MKNAFEQKFRLILGSASPRRKELLAGLDLDFTVDTLNSFKEIVPEGTPARAIPSLMSKGKSLGFHRSLEDDEILLTSDTMVILPSLDGGDDLPLGKPADKARAVEMLLMLQGRSHDVITAFTLRSNLKTMNGEDCAKVFFNSLTRKEIEYYVEKWSPLDKAGAYAIQQWIGYAAISRIEGSFYTVMGLPVHLVYESLKNDLGAIQ